LINARNAIEKKKTKLLGVFIERALAITSTTLGKTAKINDRLEANSQVNANFSGM
jgi:hypothetical protein